MLLNKQNEQLSTDEMRTNLIRMKNFLEDIDKAVAKTEDKLEDMIRQENKMRYK